MSPIIMGFLIAFPLVLLILAVSLWLLYRSDKKLDTIKIEEDVKKKIINDENERKKINKEIFQILGKHKKYERIIFPIIFIWTAIAIIIVFIGEPPYIKFLSGELFAVFLVINVIFLLKWREPKRRYVLEIIKLEEETERRILSEQNHNLLIEEFRRRREEIQFKEK